MPMWWPFAVGGSVLLAIFSTLLIRRLAMRLNIVDAPTSERKIHDRVTPLMGGTAIFISFSIIVLIVLATSNHLTSGDMGVSQILGMLLGGLILIIGGYLDDKYDLPARLSIIFPIAASIVAVVMGIGVSKITNPLGGVLEVSASISMIVTFIWLLGMTYTTKLLDGLDGLASSMVLLGGCFVALLALSEKFFQPDVALLALIFAAAILGFLLWNWHPATIFLGEGGSTFLGFTLGALAVISGSKIATALLVVGIPAFDVAYVIVRRLRDGQNPFLTADSLHLHHLLYKFGFSQRSVVLIFSMIAILFGVTSLFLTSWQKIIALVVLIILGGLSASWFIKRSRDYENRT